jgi:serine/threonine protein kinase
MVESCPSREELLDLAMGRLPEQAIERIGRHIERCAACETILASFDGLEDGFVGGLKNRSLIARPYIDPDLQRQLERAGRQSGFIGTTRGPVRPELVDGPLPRRLGTYELLSRLGQGGMGMVYLARQTMLDRPVAVKVLQAERVSDPDFIARFRREVRAVAQLDHPNIVRALDASEVAGQHFLVMEYIQGRDLDRQVKETGPLLEIEVVDVLRHAALGLQYIHDRGLVHRDIKPSNLIRTPEGIVKILDLGLARSLLSGNGLGSITRQDIRLGTAAYMAPEQARDSRKVDARADIYSLGCTVYFLLTGQPPFPYGNLGEVLVAHQKERPRPLASFRPDLSPEIVELIDAIMAKNVRHRPQTAAAVIEYLDAIRSSSKQQRNQRKHPSWELLVCVSIIIVCVGIVIMLGVIGLAAGLAGSLHSAHSKVGPVAAEPAIPEPSQQLATPNVDNIDPLGQARPDIAPVDPLPETRSEKGTVRPAPKGNSDDIPPKHVPAGKPAEPNPPLPAPAAPAIVAEPPPVKPAPPETPAGHLRAALGNYPEPVVEFAASALTPGKQSGADGWIEYTVKPQAYRDYIAALEKVLQANAERSGDAIYRVPAANIPSLFVYQDKGPTAEAGLTLDALVRDKKAGQCRYLLLVRSVEPFLEAKVAIDRHYRVKLRWYRLPENLARVPCEWLNRAATLRLKCVLSDRQGKELASQVIEPYRLDGQVMSPVWFPGGPLGAGYKLDWSWRYLREYRKDDVQHLIVLWPVFLDKNAKGKFELRDRIRIPVHFSVAPEAVPNVPPFTIRVEYP